MNLKYLKLYAMWHIELNVKIDWNVLVFPLNEWFSVCRACLCSNALRVLIGCEESWGSGSSCYLTVLINIQFPEFSCCPGDVAVTTDGAFQTVTWWFALWPHWCMMGVIAHAWRDDPGVKHIHVFGVNACDGSVLWRFLWVCVQVCVCARRSAG